MMEVLEFQQHKNMKDYIEESIYFKNLDEQDKRAILRCYEARVLKFKKNSSIINIGDEANHIYIIAQGNARSYSIDINGKEYINQEYYKDDIFGISYITNEIDIFNEELIALEDTVVIVCNGFRFLNPCENRCKRHIDCMKLTFTRLSNMIESNKSRIHSLCQSKTRNKILTYLKEISKNRKKYFKIPFNQTELANYLGVERSALSYELNLLKKEGIIDFDGYMYKFKVKINI